MRPIRTLPLAMVFACVFGTQGWAVDPNDPDIPESTPTTTSCPPETIWNPERSQCTAPEAKELKNDDRYRAVRELAYSGRYDEAEAVLNAMTEGESDRVMTYRGFLARKSGDRAKATAAYRAALELNPDNLLARSYLGLGLAAAGDLEGARAQLTEIRLRGGRGTWAEVALRLALNSGGASAY